MKVTVGKLRQVIREARFSGRNIRAPGSLANLVRLFRDRYPNAPREQAEPRILKRWLTYTSKHTDDFDPQYEAQILKKYLDEVWQ